MATRTYKNREKNCVAAESPDGTIDYICGKSSKGGRTRKQYPRDLSELEAEIDALTTEIRVLRAFVTQLMQQRE